MYYLRLFLACVFSIALCGSAVASDVDYDAVIDELKASLIAEPAKSSEVIAYLKENTQHLSREQRARVLTLESNKEMYNGAYERAFNLLTQAEQLSHSPETQNSIYLYQATALIAMKNYQGALDAMAKNLDRIEQIDDVTIKMTSYLRLANLYLDLEVYDEVKRYASLAYALSRDRSPKEQCYAQLFLAVGELKLSHYHEAKQLFTDTRTFCSEHNIPLIVAMADKGKGTSHLKLGELEQAEKLFLSALAKYKTFKFQLEINDVNALLAETYLMMKEVESAKQYAQQVIDVEDEPSVLNAKKRAYKMMADALALEGSYQEAYRYLDEYMQLSEADIDETKAKAYAYQMAKFENAEKAREIKMLNQDRALYTAQQKVVELERYNESMALMIAIGCSVCLIIFGASMFVQKRKYKRISQRDPLTGVLNRGTGQDFAENLFVDVLAHRSVFSVVMFDLDHFKAINDTYGHSAGDWALRRVVDAVTPSLKSRDLFVRMGGEEFALFLPYTDEQAALKIAKQCRVAIEAIQTRPHYSDLSITASFGVCTSVEEDLSLDPLMKRVDIAMYQAKGNGRNCVVMYRPSMESTPDTPINAVNA
ncbi:tetratricopeptide repeat-containing diguanylate cyclase [Shewanella aegiceratis]|uniref:tetratricopeptide repeat-containing diguanylate cyclase n=1 Tax=Shewanella aegiceratis TaxID=2864203 RepID=UPI001C659515|nr:GGDEF domain-containing protein [Shewanella aegiceratis]QYJ83630.1 diguanylate cyclase [Shewanella aegiceratis]